MRNRQRGVTLMGLITGSVILIFAALLGMKVLPSYIEYFAIKKAVVSIANATSGRGGSANEVRRDFAARQAIDDFTSIQVSDLVITKEGNGFLIVAAYRKEIPLFANIGIHIDFVASSK
jgi:hypothetical protein